MGVLDRHAVAGPLDKLDVVLSVAERHGSFAGKAEVIGEEREAGCLRHVRRGELEEVRQRLRDVEATVETLLHALFQSVQHLGIVDDDELRRLLVEPLEQVTNRMQLEVLEVRVALRLRRDLCDVQLVVDVAVEPEALRVQDRNRFARNLERNRHVTEPASVHGVRDHCALVADDRLVDSCLHRVTADRLEHAPGHQHHVNSHSARSGDRRAGPGPQDRVLADQRAVEVARNGVDLAREVLRKDQPCGFVRKSTRALMSLGGRLL